MGVTKRLPLFLYMDRYREKPIMSKEEFKMLKKQKNVERYIIAPQTRLYLGVKVTKETDIEDEEKTDYGTIHQTIKDLILTTTINRKSNAYGIETEEKSTLTQKVQEGTILIWLEGRGYVIPEMRVCSVEEGINDLEVLKEV